nr:MAG TPA_asm: head closure knob [Caudoviricetes sp.]
MPTPSQLNSLLNKFMYHDKVNVYRQCSIIDDEGADDYSIKEIYSQIPCKLSQDGKAFTAQNTDRQVDIIIDLKLFLSSQYDILPNDVLKISRNGQEILLNVVKSFKYKSHQEVTVKRKDEAR